MKRVVVTGLGTVNPLGNDIKTTWASLVAGKGAVGLVTKFDVTQFRAQCGAEVKDFEPEIYLDKNEIRRTDLFIRYAIYSAAQAIEDSGIDFKAMDSFDAGVIFGVGQGGVETFEKEVESYVTGGYVPRFNPFFIPKLLVNLAAGMISIKYGLQGINYCPSSACATSNTAFMDAFNYISLGKAKVIITGGAEAPITPASYGAFAAMKAMSTRNDDPATASRPFDKDRDGFVMGEGGGALIFEEYEHAVARGAKIYAEVVGAAMTADAYHLTSPHPEGIAAAQCMQLALKEAGLQPEEVDYLNLHATATPLGDIAELKAVKKVFGTNANVHLSATKSMTGHLLGAAAALEAIATILSIKEAAIPPTINVQELDPELPTGLNIVLDKALKKNVKVAMSNAFGFGGHNSTIIFKSL
ncbi:MAG: beta-ketoacyl-ACP synthase II [Taibaiella sp.]|nr:beta-ketoacyl-ACP synthase II [Taibaiella sp.]